MENAQNVPFSGKTKNRFEIENGKWKTKPTAAQDLGVKFVGADGVRVYM